MAVIAVFLACFRDWRKFLSPGERAVILLVAADREQAKILLRYIQGILTVASDAGRERDGGFYQGRQRGTKIDFAKMVQTNDAVEFKKRMDAGEFDEMGQADWYLLIWDCAAELRADNETLPQAFAKFIAGDSLGRELFRAYQNCEGRAMMKRVLARLHPLLNQMLFRMPCRLPRPKCAVLRRVTMRRIRTKPMSNLTPKCSFTRKIVVWPSG